MPKQFKINEAGDAELRIDDDHVLIIHAADEGLVVDVWLDGGEASVWSTYYFYSEMLPEEEV